MTYLPELMTALVISVSHLFLSFQLKLDDQYKRNFRRYSFVTTLLFLLFIVGFFVYAAYSPLSDQGVALYFNGLSAFYFLLFVPLGLALIWRLGQLIMPADINPPLLKYTLLIVLVALLGGIIYSGYAFFIFFFYGFAP